MPAPVSGPENLEGLATVVYDAAAVPGEVWYNLRNVHAESLRADLPKDQWGRAAKLAHLDSLTRYETSRINPNTLVGNGLQDDQLFRQPQVTVVYEGSQIVAGLTTANNTSGDHLPKPLRPLEHRAKMWLPPQLDIVPVIGGKRYVHLREAFVHPGAQDESMHVALTGLWHTLGYRHDRQTLASYIVPGDPADKAMTELTRRIGMETTDTTPNTLPGYQHEHDVVRVATRIAAARAKIEKLIGTNHLARTEVIRTTNQDAKRAEKARTKQIAQAWDDERRARHEVPGK